MDTACATSIGLISVATKNNGFQRTFGKILEDFLLDFPVVLHYSFYTKL